MVRATVALAVLALAAATPTYPSEDEMLALYSRFQTKHGHSNNVGRFSAFKANVVKAIDLNTEQNVICKDLLDDVDCVFGLTKFSAMFDDEFAATHKGYKRSKARHDLPTLSIDGLQNALKSAPVSVDWRTKGAVTPVKNQGNCGSCWAYSATEEIESGVFMATGTLPKLSEQEIISCDGTDGGCNGGDTVSAFEWVEKNGGLESEQEYPDTSATSGATGTCKKSSQDVAKVSSFSYATPACTGGQCSGQDEDTLAANLATKGPVSICVNAQSWNLYRGGIYSAKCSGAWRKLDHCVQLVGYDKSGATPYWIVRNSWDTDWGEKGYIYLEMGKNQCGVADEATLVTATAAAKTVTV